MAIYDENDISFSWNGDFLVSADYDLADTSTDALLSLLQQIHDICASSLRDWEFYPSRAATLSDFVGEPNTKETGDAIHDRLRISIVSAGLVAEEDLEIRIIPVHIHRVLVIIKINAVSTYANNLEIGEPLITSLVFDFMEQGIFFLDKTPKLLND